MKNSIDTIGNRTRDLSAFSAVPQPNAPPRAPSILYNKTRFLPRTVRTALPLQRPVSECRIGAFAVPCKEHTKHTHEMYGKSAHYLHGTYYNRWALQRLKRSRQALSLVQLFKQPTRSNNRFRLLILFKSVLHVSGDKFAHPQEQFLIV
jgi:hypothetical protein